MQESLRVATILWGGLSACGPGFHLAKPTKSALQLTADRCLLTACANGALCYDWRYYMPARLSKKDFCRVHSPKTVRSDWRNWPAVRTPLRSWLSGCFFSLDSAPFSREVKAWSCAVTLAASCGVRHWASMRAAKLSPCA